MISKQSQEGGDGSTNIQAQKMVLHVGIDEKRAREVFQEMNLQLRKDYTREALEIANSRVAEFENSLLPKMQNVEGALEAFSDPSFQLLLVDAQKTAASTERPADYDLLSELLIHRFKKGDNRVTRAGISLAVEIIDKISDEALLGLTVAHSVANFFPASGDLHLGLNTLNRLFEKIIYGKLPTGQEWLDHLDILNTVRLSSFGSLRKLQDYYSDVLCGYIDVGIEKDSESYASAIKILQDNNLSIELLVEHSLNSAYVRIPVANRAHIKDLSFQRTVVNEGAEVLVPVPLSPEQSLAIESVYDLYSNDNAIKLQNIHRQNLKH
ncbi:LPO_1073/Vpar_1526 family protein [Vibrio sp. 10N.222.49.C9]|uniref:LPO_1073/Vpar_1526 family protein n=1 Tax=Vibrio sp. 10N.222.49.C9 TaxID=3229615 RepID=UPI003553F8B3